MDDKLNMSKQDEKAQAKRLNAYRNAMIEAEKEPSEGTTPERDENGSEEDKNE